MPTTTVEAPPGHLFFVRGPHCWGKATTERKAKRLCAQNKPSFVGRVKRYQIDVAPDDAWIDQMDGTLRWKDHDAKACPHCTVVDNF